jgi:hypothetical protein
MQAWPGTIRGVYGDQERYEATYFAPYKGYYFSGDGARRDADGYYWITGALHFACRVTSLFSLLRDTRTACSLKPACLVRSAQLRPLHVAIAETQTLKQSLRRRSRR